MCVCVSVALLQSCYNHIFFLQPVQDDVSDIQTTPSASQTIGQIEIEKILPGDVRNPLVKQEVIQDFGGKIKVQVHSSLISV